jgi:hypothetical protein
MGLSLLATTDTQIIRVVEALYKQTPGYTFLTNFRTYVTENSIDDLANSLASSFSSQTDAQLAAVITGNLGLTGDAQTAGNAYLEGQFAANPAARGKVVLDAMNLLATMESDATFGAVAASFNSNTVASLTYSTVVANTAVLAAGVGQTFALTTATDGAAVAGTTKDDVYSAIVDLATTNSTLTSSDNIAAGAGADSLTITATGTGAESVTGVTTSGLESIAVTSLETTTTNTLSIDAALMTGVTSIAANNSTADGEIAFTNLGALAAASLSANAGDLTLTYGTTVVAGTTDTQALTVSGTNAGTFTANGIETITITTATSAATATVASDAVTNITVSGDQNLTLAATTFAVTTSTATVASTIDASALTGNLTATISDTSTVEVKGGSGDDTINMAALLETNDIIDGGAGTDTLTMAAAALTTQFTNVTNVETVSFNEVETAQVMNVAKLSAGVTKVILDVDDGALENGALLANTVTGLSGQTVVIRHSESDGDDTADDDGVSYTITNATDTVSDSISIELDGIGTGSSGSAVTNFGINNIDVNAFETVNIASNTNSIATFAADGTTAAVAIGGITLNTLDLLTVSGTTTTVALTGATDLTITDISGAVMTSLDASAMTGKFVGTLSVADDVTVKLAADSSTINFGSTLNNADSVIGGAGVLDVVNASVSGLTASTGALTISAVETVNLTTGGNNALNLAGVTGATTISLTDNVQTITGLDLGATIHLNGAATASEIDVTAADATGTSDTLKVSTTGATDSIIDASAIETLALTKNDAANTVTLDLTTFEGTAITLDSKTDITGTAAVDLGTLHANANSLTSTYADQVTAVFANATAGVTATVVGTDVQTITGSAFIDTFNVGSTTAITHVIAGGAGEDTINLTHAADASAEFGSISAIQTFNLAIAAGADVVVNGAFHADVDDITVTGGNTTSTLTTATLAATVETLDASGFQGNILATVAADNLDSTVTFTGGDLLTDKVSNTVTTAATTYALKSTGVEILALDVNGAGNTTVSLAAATGVTSVTVDLAASITAAVTISNVGSEVITIAAAAGGDDTVQATLVSSAGTADTVAFKSGASNAAGLKIKTTDIETVTINSDNAASYDLSLLSMATAGKTMGLTVTGDSALTVTALGADVTTINASGMTTGGSVVQEGRSATVASTYTGTLGDDTFIMMNKSDVIDGGAGTSDTLDINKAFVLGGIAVDLSSTTNQVSTFNGSANTAVQKGFENVDVSGVSGSFGAQITAISTGSTITGTANADVITGGAGADIIHFNGTTDIDDIDTIAGGAGANSIVMDVASTAIDDADFANTTLIQTFTLATGINTAVFGTNAAAAGIVTINGANGGVQTISGSSNAETITTGAGDHDDIITGGGGNDILSSSNATDSDSFVFEATAAANGEDAITSFTAGATDKDILDVGAFLGTTDVTTGGVDGVAIDATAGIAITTVTAGAAVNGTDIEDQAFVWGGTTADLATLIEDSTANDKLYLADGAKAFALIGTMANGAVTYSAYYITGTGTDTETITLVGTVGVIDGDALDHFNFA